MLKELERHVKNNIEHPFHVYPQYYENFLKYFRAESVMAMFKRKKMRTALLNKLQLSCNYNRATYCQGVSEVMLWLYFANQNITFETEKKVAEANQRDVDLHIQEGRFLYNIEIKSPTVQFRSPNALHLHVPFRTIPKDESEKAINAFKQEFGEPLLSMEGAMFTNIQVDKINDNKLVDYLKSAREKFPELSPIHCNALFIAVQTTDISDYFGYLVNGYTGIFSGREPIMQQDDYRNVDVVVLSNLVDGHLNPEKISDPWNLNKYFNLMILNQANAMSSTAAQERLLSLVPNSTLEFEGYHTKFEETVKQEARSKNDPFLEEDLKILLFPHYFDEHFPQFWK